MKPTQVRQGDVFLRPTTKTPTGERQAHLTLAHGEVTGHSHTIERTDAIDLPPAALFQEPDGSRVLLVDRPCVLRHQEHGEIALVPGCYKVVIQREYSPEAVRSVID